MKDFGKPNLHGEAQRENSGETQRSSRTNSDEKVRIDFWTQQNLQEKLCIIPRLPVEKNLERKLHNSDERKTMKKSKETSEEEFREEFRGSS